VSAGTRRAVPRTALQNAVSVHRAERRWETLALNSGLRRSCDARLCAKLAKSRKNVPRRERRAVRQLLREAIAA
jgi:hypothetical protein